MKLEQEANTIQLTSVNLSAANGSKIHTYGTSIVDICFKQLRRAFSWTCVVADVVTPILGADFLKQSGLIVDLTNQRLIDRETRFYLNCEVSDIQSPLLPVTLISNDTPSDVGKLLTQYRQITTPFEATGKVLHGTVHRVETTGMPLFCKPRPLHGEKLEAMKKEFKKPLGIPYPLSP